VPPPRAPVPAGERALGKLVRGGGPAAHDRGGVLRVDEQAHPGEHVANLGAAQEASVAGVGSGAIGGRVSDLLGLRAQRRRCGRFTHRVDRFALRAESALGGKLGHDSRGRHYPRIRRSRETPAAAASAIAAGPSQLTRANP
jgi:hypothetical protein